MPTLFEKMWTGNIPALTVMKHEVAGVGVMAVLANPQETPGQLVVFPRRAVDTLEELNWGERDVLTVATYGLAAHIKRVLPGVERVVQHVEGYGVPDHAHTVLLPSYQRGDSDRIHHPSPRRPHEEFEQEFAAIKEALQFPEDMFEAELAARQGYYQALIEDAT